MKETYEMTDCDPYNQKVLTIQNWKGNFSFIQEVIRPMNGKICIYFKLNQQICKEISLMSAGASGILVMMTFIPLVWRLSFVALPSCQDFRFLPISDQTGKGKVCTNPFHRNYTWDHKIQVVIQ